MTKFAESIDALDRRVLAVVQRDASLTHQEIGERVGLSASAVRRRLTALRTTGVIRGDVSLLDPNRSGVILIVTLSFGEESPEIYDAFDRQMRSLPEVKQSYHVAGANDYALVVHGPSLQWYEDWSKLTLMKNPAIRRYETMVVWSCKKFETALDV